MKPEKRWQQEGGPVSTDGLLDPKAIRPQREAGALVALKHGEAYLVGDAGGDLVGEGEGLFLEGVPVLTRWRLSLEARAPVLLSSSVSQDNMVHTANLTSRCLPPVGAGPDLDAVVHIERKRLLCDGRYFEQLTFSNFSRHAVELPLSIEFLVDASCQPVSPPRTEFDNGLGFDCEMAGQSQVLWIQFSQKPHTVSRQRATFLLALVRGSSHVIYAEVGREPAVPDRSRFRNAAAHVHWSTRVLRRRGTRMQANARTFNTWVEKARSDLALLTTQLPTGPFPVGEIPPRADLSSLTAIMTAMQTLWFDPALARGVLRALSREDLVATGGPREVLPLFAVLAGSYAERTGDLYFIDELWPSLDKAVRWIEDSGDQDGDGLIDEGPELSVSPFEEAGLTQNGRCARLELQAYCYRALASMSAMAERRHQFDAAARYQRAAERLRSLVEATFWLPNRNFYARAVDSSGQHCAVRSTAAGHLLLAGLPSAARGRLVVEHLLSPDFNTGWGLRTVARGEAGYNPMSWHSGTIWPHDTAMCAVGMARYGERDGAVRLIGQMFDAAMRFDMRLPQLFCGFPRNTGEGPVAYPQIAQPQAWAAGSVFLLLQACLGLRIDGYRGALHINRPRLPPDVDQLVLKGLLVGSRQINMTYHRAGNGVVAYSDDFFDGSVPVLQHA